MAHKEIVFSFEGAEYLETENFKYLAPLEKEEIKSKVDNGEAIIFSTGKDFSGVLEFYKSCLHVREVAGENFLKYYKYLDILAVQMARKLNYKSISVRSENRAVRRVIEKLGFLAIDETRLEYERSI